MYWEYVALMVVFLYEYELVVLHTFKRYKVAFDCHQIVIFLIFWAILMFMFRGYCNNTN